MVVALFLLVAVLPVSIAVARRLWRRGDSPEALGAADLSRRLDRLEHAVDAVAIEVERIGEHQRHAALASAAPMPRSLSDR